MKDEQEADQRSRAGGGRVSSWSSVRELWTEAAGGTQGSAEG